MACPLGDNAKGFSVLVFQQEPLFNDTAINGCNIYKKELLLMKKSELKKLLVSDFKEKFRPVGFKKSKYGFIKIDNSYSYKFIFASIR